MNCQWKYTSTYLLVCLSMCLILNCVPQTDKMVKLEEDIAEVKRQLAALQQADQQKQTLLNQLIQKLDSVLTTITRSNADMSSEVTTLFSEIRALQGELETNAHKINLLMKHLDELSGSKSQSQTDSGLFTPTPQSDIPGRQEAIPPMVPTSQSSDIQFDEERLYQNAYKNYLSGKYSLAIDSFKNFLQAFPSSQLADNAQYWIGECYYSQNLYRPALSEFTQLTQTYSSGDKIPAAMLKMGLCYLELQLPKQAKETFEALVKQYPNSTEAFQANEKLKLLN